MLSGPGASLEEQVVAKFQANLTARRKEQENAAPKTALEKKLHSVLGRIKHISDRIVENRWFQPSIIFLILLNNLFLCFYNANKEEANEWIEKSEWFFQSVFTIEAILKIFHLGLKGYFRDAFNRFDFILVFFGWILAPFATVNLTAIRVFRVFRTLRLLKFIPGMSHVIEVVSRSSSQLLSVVFIVLFINYAFAIIGVELYKDANQTGKPGIENNIPGFQDILQSMFTVFITITAEGWEDIMIWLTPQYEPEIVQILFFIVLTALGTLVVLNLIVTVLVLNHAESTPENYEAIADATAVEQYKKIVLAAKERKRGLKVSADDMRKRLMLSYEKGNNKVLSEDIYTSYLRKFGPQTDKPSSNKRNRFAELKPGSIASNIDTKKREVGMPQALEVFFALVVIANVIVLGFSGYNESPETGKIVFYTNVTCGAIYLVEIYGRILWKGPMKALKSKVLIMEYLLINIGFALTIAEISRVVFAFRLIIILVFTDRIGIKDERYRKILALSFRHVAPFMMLLALLVHIFAVLGLLIYGSKFNNEVFLGYNTYMRSLLTTFQIVTSEGWNEVVYEAISISEIPYFVTLIYYFILLVLGNFIMLNLILALMIDTFVGFLQEVKSDPTLSESDQLHIMKTKLNEMEKSISERNLTKSWSRQSIKSFQTGNSHSSERSLPQGKTSALGRILHGNLLDLLALGTTIIYCIFYYLDPTVEIVCLSIFWFEMIVRSIVSIGCKESQLSKSYGFEKSLILDLIVIMIASLHIIVKSVYIFALRPLIALRLIHWFHPLNVMANAAIRGASTIANLVLYVFLVFSVFSILFVELFGGKLHTCFDSNGIELPGTCYPHDGAKCNASLQCIAHPGINVTWRNKDRYISFDSYPSSMQALLEMMTLELWTDTMFLTTQAVGVGYSPVVALEESYRDAYGFLVVLVVCVGYLFLLQIFIAVANETYMFTERKLKGVDVLSNKQRLWVELQIKCIFNKPRAKGKHGGGFRARIFKIVDSSVFDKFIVLVILVDSIIMALQRKDQPEIITQLNIITQYFSGSIFLIEAILKIIAYGKDYFKSRRNLFDLFIVLCVIIGWIEASNPSINIVLGNLTPLRVLRAAFFLPNVKTFLQLLGAAVPAFGQILMILAFFFYIYMLSGLDLFHGSVQFESFRNAFMTLYVLTIGDDWIQHMRVMSYGKSEFAWEFATGLYFGSFIIIVTFTTINLLIAVMLTTFEHEFVRKSLDQKSLARFRRKWSKAHLLYRERLYKTLLSQLLLNSDDRNRQSLTLNNPIDVQLKALEASASLRKKSVAKKLTKSMAKNDYLPPELILPLLYKLKPPLGLVDFKKGDYTNSEVLALIHLSKIPLTRSNLVNYNSVLFYLSEFRYRMNTLEKDLPIDWKNIALKLHLDGENRKKFENMLNEQNDNYQLSHYLAARVIQRYYFAHHARKTSNNNSIGNIDFEQQRSNSDISLTSYASIESISADDEDFKDSFDRSFILENPNDKLDVV